MPCAPTSHTEPNRTACRRAAVTDPSTYARAFFSKHDRILHNRPCLHEGLRKWKSPACFSLLGPQAARRIQERVVLEPSSASLGRLLTAHEPAAKQAAVRSGARSLGAGRAARAESVALELHHYRSSFHRPGYHVVEFHSRAAAAARSFAHRPRDSRRSVRLLCLAPAPRGHGIARLPAWNAGERVEASVRTSRSKSCWTWSRARSMATAS